MTGAEKTLKWYRDFVKTNGVYPLIKEVESQLEMAVDDEQVNKNESISDVSFSSRDMLKEIINECPYIFDYATVPKDKDLSNPQIAGSLIMSYQRYLKAQNIVSNES